MKYLTKFLILIFTTNYCLSQIIDSYSFNPRIKDLILKVEENSANGSELSELKNYGFEFQNRGFLLDERDHDYKNALIEIDKAIFLWTTLKDTLNEANLRKYKGLLLGYLNDFIKAKSEIQKAIYLFSLKNYTPGINVSKHDLSRVYEQVNMLDSSLFIEKEVLQYWKSIQNEQRIFSSYNQILNLYCKSQQYEEAEKMLIDSEKLILTNNFHWQSLIDFYYLAFRFYEILNNTELITKFRNLYIENIEILKRNGINAISTYDNK